MPVSEINNDKCSAVISGPTSRSEINNDKDSAALAGPTSRIDEYDRGGFVQQCQYPFVFSDFDVSWHAMPGGNIDFEWQTETEKTWKRVRWKKVGQAWNYLDLTEVDPAGTSFVISMPNAGKGNYEWQAWNRDECDNTQYSNTQTFTITFDPFGGGWRILGEAGK
jgi:hypothetical protein